MKLNIYLAFFMGVILISCNPSTKDNTESDEHHHDGPEGVVMLSELQRESLNLKLGSFQMRNLTTMVKTNGQLEVPPAASANITALMGGNVKKIKVFHGDKVYKGQVLALLEHPDFISIQEEFAETANKLEFLKLEYSRQKELFENNVGAGKEFQRVKSEYNTAKARYEGFKSRLQLLNLSPEKVKEGKISNTISILSPINGYINEVNVSVGTYVDAKDQLFSIRDNREIHADFLVYENDVHLIKKGQKIDFTVSNHPNEELRATIFAIGREFDPNIRAVHIHAKLDNNPGNLIPGMYVTGNIHTDEKSTRSLPDDAIVTEGTKTYIFIHDETIDTDDKHMHDEDIIDENDDDHKDHDGHDHAIDEDHVDGTMEHDHESHVMAFKMVEVITGKKDGGYTEIKLLNPLSDDTKIVLNAAYFLMAEMNKEETEHVH